MNTLILFRDNPGIKVDRSPYTISTIYKKDLGNIDEWKRGLHQRGSHLTWLLHYNVDAIRKFFINSNQIKTIPNENEKYITFFGITQGSLKSELDYFTENKKQPLVKKIFDDLRKNKTHIFILFPDQMDLLHECSIVLDDVEKFVETHSLPLSSFTFVSSNYNLSGVQQKDLNTISFSRYAFTANIEKLRIGGSFNKIVESTSGYVRQHKFLGLVNNCFKPHRLKLLFFFLENDFFNDGIFTIYPFLHDVYKNKDDFYRELEGTYDLLMGYYEFNRKPLFKQEEHSECTQMKKRKQLLKTIYDLSPLRIDTKLPDHYGDDDITQRQFLNFSFALSSYWNLTTETDWDFHGPPNEYQPVYAFLSEKTWKPILGLQPFIMCASHGYLNVLHELGFKTFDKWIDESYDKEVDFPTRMTMIEKEMLKLKSLNIHEIDKMYWDMYDDVLLYNYNQLDNHIDEEWKKLKNNIEKIWEGLG
tara:strand:+ start:1711 stop:3132 length:1422 start_codon:yes stop_codon:yes gene_type:complete